MNQVEIIRKLTSALYIFDNSQRYNQGCLSDSKLPHIHFPFISRERGKGKSAHEPIRPNGLSLSWFLQNTACLEVYLLPLLDAMLVYRRVTPLQYVAGTHLYTWVKGDKVE